MIYLFVAQMSEGITGILCGDKAYISKEIISSPL